LQVPLAAHVALGPGVVAQGHGQVTREDLAQPRRQRRVAFALELVEGLMRL
jgi:hypothetical protein